jgi:hypothetical protein
MAHSHVVRDMDKHFIIDPIARTVTNAESKKTLLMQNDHNSERFSFEIDKIVEGHDMTLCNKVEVHYTNFDANKKNVNPGVYEVDDVEVSTDDPNKIVFTWLVSQNATKYNGTLQFNVVFACVENGDVTYRWSSGMNNSIAIAKSLNNGDAIEDAYPDILTQWKRDLYAAMHGMEVIHIGPTEPKEYPYIWFDTSRYTGVSDNDIGVLTIKNAEGVKRTLYPFAKLAGTDGNDIRVHLLDILDQLDNKVDDDKIANNLTVKDGGYVLDARQGTWLNENKIGYNNIANHLTATNEGSVLDARQGAVLKNLIDNKSISWQTKIILGADKWMESDEDYTQTVTVKEVTENCAIVVSPEPDSFEEYSASIIFASSMSDGAITFTALNMPSIDLAVQLLIVTVGDDISDDNRIEIIDVETNSKIGTMA